MARTKPRRPRAVHNPDPAAVRRRDMILAEKVKLSGDLQALPLSELQRVADFLKARFPALCKKFPDGHEEVHVNLGTFDNETLWELQRFAANAKEKRHALEVQARGGKSHRKGQKKGKKRELEKVKVPKKKSARAVPLNESREGVQQLQSKKQHDAQIPAQELVMEEHDAQIQAEDQEMEVHDAQIQAEDQEMQENDAQIPANNQINNSASEIGSANLWQAPAGVRPRGPRVEAQQRPLTADEEDELVKAVEALPTHMLENVAEIVSRCNPQLFPEDDELEVDLHLCNMQTLVELSDLVADYNLSKQ